MRYLSAGEQLTTADKNKKAYKKVKHGDQISGAFLRRDGSARVASHIESQVVRVLTESKMPNARVIQVNLIFMFDFL